MSRLRVPEANEVENIQEEIRLWRANNFGDLDGTAVLKKLTEEVGELWAAHHTRDRAEQIDGVGDILVALLGYSSEIGLNGLECLKRTWEIVRKRDYRKYPGRGRP
jgi:NTP pyrophosphatase (non-canonical NTP hydrolase)